MGSSSPPTAGSGHSGAQDPFADHFDHYAMLVSRYGKRSTSSRGSGLNEPLYAQISAKSRQPSNSGLRLSGLFNEPMGTPQSPLSPSGSILGHFDQPSADHGVEPSSANTASGTEYSEQQSTEAGGSGGKAAWRTASLYRPTVPTPVAAAGGGGGKGLQRQAAVIRRKPSLQANPAKQIQKPVMSREEVGAMSHAQREYVRKETELAEQLARNPLKYFVTPRFKGWLHRQRLLLLILTVNIALAALFYKLLAP